MGSFGKHRGHWIHVRLTDSFYILNSSHLLQNRGEGSQGSHPSPMELPGSIATPGLSFSRSCFENQRGVMLRAGG